MNRVPWPLLQFLLGWAISVVVLPAEVPAGGNRATVLGVNGTHFTVNGNATFLLGFSYYGALGAPEDFIRLDLDDFQRRGFNWLRVWANWTSFESDVSAVGAHGQPREPFFSKLKWLVAECDRRGLVVDVTLTRGKERLGGLPSHKQAVQSLVGALKSHRNWYLDLGNEHDVPDDRFVPVAEVKRIREQVRQLDPLRLVTASFGGHDLTRDDLRDALLNAELDFICPHRPRTPESASQTEDRTRSLLVVMKELGRLTPVLYQEPFRRGYTQWEPVAGDFLADLRGAVAAGAAGWCFHNGQQRNTPGNEPRRSFDLHTRRLFDQLDVEERKLVDQGRAILLPGNR
jgi:hypothetical protein